MALQYRAAVLHAAQTPLSIETVTAAGLQPTDVLVRIRAAGLCHTDLEVIERSRLADPVRGISRAGAEGARVRRQQPRHAGRWPRASAADVRRFVRRILHR